MELYQRLGFAERAGSVSGRGDASSACLIERAVSDFPILVGENGDGRRRWNVRKNYGNFAELGGRVTGCMEAMMVFYATKNVKLTDWNPA